MSDSFATVVVDVIMVLILLGFVVALVGGFIIGWDDATKRQEIVKNSKPVNSGPPEDIINSDGKPDLPLDSK